MTHINQRFAAAFCTALLLLLSACSFEPLPQCSVQQIELIDRQVMTGDGRGHGPDVGSDEWQSVIEFTLGLRGKADLPARNTASWCALMLNTADASTVPASKDVRAPSFDCTQVKHSQIESLVCQDVQLSVLDQKLAAVYQQASKKAVNQHPPTLKAEQSGWIKGRDECWKESDHRQCTANAYQRRIAELQAYYQLVPFKGPYYFQCDENAANELVVSFYETTPPSMIAERGDSVAWMTLEPSASGSKYQGRNELFWEHQGEATVAWGYNAAEMTCRKIQE